MPDPDPRASLRQSRAVFDLALRLPCKRHTAKSGDACWTLPASESDTMHSAVCARRLGSLPKRRSKR